MNTNGRGSPGSRFEFLAYEGVDKYQKKIHRKN